MSAGIGHPVILGTTETKEISTSSLIGFIATGSGTINLSKRNGVTGAVEPIIEGIPVTSGEWLDIPFKIDGNFLIITTVGSASGAAVVK